MNQALIHRGPDDGGQFDHGHFSMAMRRLSIIDLGGGHQPIENEDGTLVIVFNGEIYNFLELRKDLLRKGHRFKTNSDTEVILHLYEEVGVQVAQQLRGMFAFCIYDRRDGSLFIARDRFGEKPLYYSMGDKQGFVFSSEIKSLLEHPAIPRRLDHEALAHYLRAGIVPAPLTMFRDVCVLPAGHWLRWRSGEPEIQPYFAIDYQSDPHLEESADAIEAVSERLLLSVKRQSISDVPVGALLSGGIDSSAVAAMLQADSPGPVKTFTVRFQNSDYDEGLIARAVAKHLGTEHHEIMVEDATFQAEDLWRIIDHVGVPFFDSSAIPMYMLSKQVRQQVKVAMSGDGGDELFAGYEMYQWGQKIHKVQQLPRPIVQGGLTVFSWITSLRAASGSSVLRRIRRGLEGAAEAPRMLPITVHNLFSPLEIAGLVLDETVVDTACGDLPRLTDLPDAATDWTPLRKLMYFSLTHVLPDRMITKVDRMSMAASLEIRSPMLDADLAELSMRLPDRHLIEKGVGKSIIRKTIRPLVPEIVLTHPKTGFDIPLHSFHNDTKRGLVNDLLVKPSPAFSGLFRAESVQKIVENGLGRTDGGADKSIFRTSHQLWALLQFAAWMHRYQVSV